MDDAALRLEALKSMRDWSSWLVTVSLAIASLAVAAMNQERHRYRKYPMGVAVILLGISAVFSTFLLGSLPSAIQRLRGTDDLYSITLGVEGPLSGITLGTASFAQHGCFVLALLALGVRAALSLVPPNE